MARKLPTQFLVTKFARPDSGACFTPNQVEMDCTFSGLPAWQSNGGPHRGHPSRSLPFSLEAHVGEDPGNIVRVHFLGVFALYAGKTEEAAGTLGASIQLGNSRDTFFRQDLLNGRHYRDARDLVPIALVNGDGSSIQTVGEVELNGTPMRVDMLTLDIPNGLPAETIRFKDLGSPASFVIFDIVAERIVTKGCPFHAHSGGISLGELGSSIRIGDRAKYMKALEQMDAALLSTPDLDEAKGEALTFLAVVTAATIEIGGSRQMHRALLESAREFEGIDSVDELAAAVRRRAEAVTSGVFKEISGSASYLVERALAIVERNYAKDLTDASIAETLGLSTSHFRYLFKEATGQPFHKFLISLRLEKARSMLVEQEIAVSAVAKAVGFAGLSHFSRAFTQRFQVSPTSVRRSIE